MILELYLNSMSWGGKRKLSVFLKVSTATVTKWSKPIDHPEKRFPSSDNAKGIEKFSEENPEYGKITLEDILGQEKAYELRKIWEYHGQI